VFGIEGPSRCHRSGQSASAAGRPDWPERPDHPRCRTGRPVRSTSWRGRASHCLAA